MAEGIIGSLLIKIGAALAAETTKLVCLGLTGEALALSRFRQEIGDVKEELLSIQGFLREAERCREKNENIQNYVREIRGVAFEIENTIDEFTYKLGDVHNEGAVTRTIKKIRHVKTWYQLTKKLTEIKGQIKNIDERRKRYDMSSIVKRAIPQSGGSWRTADDEHFVEEDDLVGIEENKNALIELVKDAKNEQKIISVWGMGGVGKTALVTHVYKAVTKSFDACAWISVSQTWDKDQLLRSILVEFQREYNKFQRENKNENVLDGLDSLDHRGLVDRIQTYLHDKRYLIILDDVWRVDAWRSIKNVFSADGTIGRVVLTTRNQHVASLAPKEQIIKINPLEMDPSFDLFCKTAFKKNDNSSCPQELRYWSIKIVEKCGGLPLAIQAIAGLLECRPEQNEWEWKRVYEDLENELVQNPDIDYVNKIINLSFEDFPYYLKNCLLYCSLFPEDYNIEGEHLIRLWVTEGFIEKRENRTLEELADEYIGELVSRCLLQVVERNNVGGVRRCVMHDIIRALALSKSKEERFGLACDSSTIVIRGEFRRLSIQNNTLERINDDLSHLRSLLVFNNIISLETLSMVLRSCKLLRVLDLQGVPIEKLPKEVFDLFNLHFLGLRNTKIAEIPKSIGRLQNLQVLDGGSSRIVSLPKEIKTLKKLRHLYCCTISDRKADGSFTYISPVVPKGICHLKDLQTLNSAEANDHLVEDITALTGLKSMRLSNVTNSQCTKLFMAISNMSQLIHLDIRSKDDKVLNLSAFSPPVSLQYLVLHGRYMESLHQFCMHLQNHKLATLALGTIFDEDIFSYLYQMPYLSQLYLYRYVGSKLCFPEISLPKLQLILIRNFSNLNEIEIKRGAMKSLREITFSECPELKKVPQGLEYLSNLSEFRWFDPNKCVIEEVKRERLENQCSESRMRVLSMIRFYDHGGKEILI